MLRHSDTAAAKDAAFSVSSGGGPHRLPMMRRVSVLGGSWWLNRDARVWLGGYLDLLRAPVVTARTWYIAGAELVGQNK